MISIWELSNTFNILSENKEDFYSEQTKSYSSVTDKPFEIFSAKNFEKWTQKFNRKILVINFCEFSVKFSLENFPKKKHFSDVGSSIKKFW